MLRVTSLTFIMKTTIKTGILLSAYGKNFSALVPSKLLLCIMLTIRCCVEQKLFAKRKIPSQCYSDKTDFRENITEHTICLMSNFPRGCVSSYEYDRMRLQGRPELLHKVIFIVTILAIYFILTFCQYLFEFRCFQIVSMTVVVNMVKLIIYFVHYFLFDIVQER